MRDDLKSRRLDRPIVRSFPQRRQPIAALHLRLDEFLVVRVRSQRRLARLSARGDRVIHERLEDRVQRLPPLLSVDGQVHHRDPLRHRPIGLRPPLRIRRTETDPLGNHLDLTRIRRNIDQKIDRGLRPQLDREADDIPAQGQGFVTHGQLQIEQTMNNYRRRPPRSTQDVGVYTEETKKMKERASQQRTRNWNGRVTDMPCSVSRVFMAALKPDKPRRHGSSRRFSPSARRPNSSRAKIAALRRPSLDASARSCLAGAGPARPTSLEPHPRDRRHEPKARGDGKRNEVMNTIAEFTIIGRVGEIKQVGTTVRVSIASSYSRKDNRGEWVERTRWNEVTVFGESTRGYVKRNLVKGDLVFTSGSMGQTKWEKDGETFYGVTLAGERIERLSKGPNHGDDKADEPQERRSGPADDSDIPF